MNDTARRGMRLVALLGLVMLLAGGGAAAWLFDAWSTPYRAFAGEEKLLIIEPGSRTRDIIATLQAEGILHRELPALAYLWLHRDRGGIKAGEYRFHETLDARQVAELLIEGRVHQRKLTVPEGLSVWEVAELLAAHGLGESNQTLELMQDPTPIRDLDPAATDLEGYLFPDTYFYVRGDGMREVIGRMVARFREVFQDEWRGRAAALGLNVRQVVTLASLVEKETAVGEERPIIAAVFHRRLAARIPLQCDPTVVYASRRIGKFDGTIRQSDLRLDSPYNTYLRAGLPPGPIASPGAASLEAALSPASVPYLYFVARNDGTHQFSETLSAHNKAVRHYQR